MIKHKINYISKLILLALIISFDSRGNNNILPLPSENNSIQFEQKQRLKLESNQRNELENKNIITSNEYSTLNSHHGKCIEVKKINIEEASFLSLYIKN